MPETPEALRAVDRGLAVLAALADPGEARSVSDVAARVGFSRAAVRRALLTLTELGYVREDPPGRYRPHANVLKLGWRTLALRPLAELAAPVLRELCDRTGQIVVLSRRFGIEIIVEAVVAPDVGNLFHVAAGDRLPPLTSDAGRLLYTRDELAGPMVALLVGDGGEAVVRFVEGLTAVERDGYSVVDQEMEVGLLSLGVPVRGREGRIPAALSLFAYAGSTTPEHLLRHLPALREGAARLEDDLLRGASAFALG